MKNYLKTKGNSKYYVPWLPYILKTYVKSYSIRQRPWKALRDALILNCQKRKRVKIQRIGHCWHVSR